MEDGGDINKWNKVLKMSGADDYQNLYLNESKIKRKKKTKDNTLGNPNGVSIVNIEDDVTNNLMKKKTRRNNSKNEQHLNFNENDYAYDWEIEDKLKKHFFDDIDKSNNTHKKTTKKKLISELDLDEDFELAEELEDDKKFHAFTGNGTSISSVNTKGLRVDKRVVSKVNKNKPICKVNIRLFNGEVVNEDFNLDQTLQDVMDFVRKKSRSNNFSLIEGFPPRPLEDYNKTIEELHLEGSLITQKII